MTATTGTSTCAASGRSANQPVNFAFPLAAKVTRGLSTLSGFRGGHGLITMRPTTL